MPSLPPSIPRQSKLPAWLSVTGRFVRVAITIAIVLFCVTLLAIRFVVLPEFERNRDALTRLLTDQIGHPVEIDAITTGWDGWNPRLDLRDLRMLERAGGAAIVTLPEARLVVAWTSVPLLQLRLKELVLVRPTLAVRRDANGVLHLGSLSLDPGQDKQGPGATQWLLRQRRISIHDGSIAWDDEQHGGPPLTLEQVEFRLENGFGHHRFGMTGVPPRELAAPLDLRGDITAGAFGDWRRWSGRFYARLDYADIAAWRSWFPSTIPIRTGQGALRLWVQSAHGEPRELIADVVLADVHAQAAPGAPELALASLEGRLGWRDHGTEREFFTRQLTFLGSDGIRFEPTDFKLVMDRANARDVESVKIEFDRLDLAPLRMMANYLPLPEQWRSDLARFAPQGRLEQGKLQWRGAASSPQSFSLSARLSDFGVAAQDSLPGVRGLSGTLEATQSDGQLKLKSRSIAIDVPHVLSEPLAFDTAEGAIGWKRDHDELALSIETLALANAHAAGQLSGSYHTLLHGPGYVDLTGQLSRADVRFAHRYLPKSVGGGVEEWLRRALVAGTAADTRVRLSGNLADFPFADGKKGQFTVTVKAQGVSLDYAEHWPMLTDMDGDIRFEGARLVIDAHRGHALGASLDRISAELRDLRVRNALLRVEGEASGPMAEFLRFIDQSPVAGWIDHSTDGIEATGTGKLALRLELPLGNPEGNQVSGEYSFNGNRVRLGGDVPMLNDVNGKLDFSERELRSTALSAKVLGGPAKLSLMSADGQLRITAQGSANLGELRNEYPGRVLINRLSGTTDWQIVLNARPTLTTWTLESNLKGAVVDLPAPAGKAAADAVPLRIEHRPDGAGRDMIAINYQRVGRLVVGRRAGSGNPVVDRALLVLGSAQGDASRPGLWIRGDIDTVDVDDWLALKQQLDAAEPASVLALSGLELSAKTIDIFGRRLSDLHVAAARSGEDWQIDIGARELLGSAHWQTSDPARPNGRIEARLKRLTPPPAAPEHGAAAATTTPESNATAHGWPELSILADRFQINEHELGRLEVTAQPRGPDWEIESLKLTNEDGTLSAKGWWRGSGSAERTQLDADLDVSDAGRYLARFGLPDAVRNAPTKIRGLIAWSGGPQAFDYPTLRGAFHLQSGQGQFTRLDPGLGKLLGVLSLQSLRRRLTFDFRDIFAEGFAFDDITGDVRIEDGVMKSDNLQIFGPAARVAITGEADIARETQRLKVRVQPTLSGSVSVGAAALLLANPILGAAVGAGSLLAQKILKDPIEQMFAYDYAVTGSWSDPVVERNGRKGSPARAASSTERTTEQ